MTKGNDGVVAAATVAAAAVPGTLSISRITDEGPISPLSKRVLVLMFLVALTDSYDQIALAFVAPSLVREWGIDKAAMGPIFSIQMLGLLIGAILFGYLGDRVGRKFAVISGTLLFSLLSLATIAADTIGQMMVVRFLVGLCVGGVIPNAIVLTNEFSPRRYQVTAVSLMFVGYVCGGIGGGFVSAWLIPRFGWEVVFLVGGVVPLLLALALMLFLPESLRFLATSISPERQAKASRIAAAMRPDLDIPPGTRIVNELIVDKKISLRDLFDGRLRRMTLLLWLLYLANSITVFGLISWLPLLTEAMDFAPAAAALGTSLLFAGAAIGGVVMSRMVDRVGLRPLIVIPAIAIPVVAGIGFLGGSGAMILYAVMLAVGVLVFGFQNALHGIGGSIYPTRIRALGVGWAMSAGKIGGILGPLMGGVMLSQGASPQAIFIAAAAPLLVAMAGAAMLRATYDSEVHAEAGATPAIAAGS